MMLDLRRPHWAHGFALLPHDPYFWLALLTGIMGVVLAFYYLRCAEQFFTLMKLRFPELWSNWPRGRYGTPFIWGKDFRNDPALCGSGPDRAGSDFLRLLSAARWAAAGFLLDFVVFLIFLAKITPVF